MRLENWQLKWYIVDFCVAVLYHVCVFFTSANSQLGEIGLCRLMEHGFIRKSLILCVLAYKMYSVLFILFTKTDDNLCIRIQELLCHKCKH